MNAQVMVSDSIYVGFWQRFVAALVDAVLLLMITLPPLYLIYGAEYFHTDKLVVGPADLVISWILPFIVTVLFWTRKRATPGKMSINAQVVDADTLGSITVGQAIIRYLCYWVSALPLLLGFIWAGFDPRKQTWHDKIANTVVIDKSASR